MHRAFIPLNNKKIIRKRMKERKKGTEAGQNIRSNNIYVPFNPEFHPLEHRVIFNSHSYPSGNIS